MNELLVSIMHYTLIEVCILNTNNSTRTCVLYVCTFSQLLTYRWHLYLLTIDITDIDNLNKTHDLIYLM